MANFEVLVHEIEVLEHPNADALEIVKVLGYQAVVRKDTFHSGDLAVYIPEQSVVPRDILQRLNLWDYEQQKGKLAGSKGDRVKAVRLRGVLSQGLLLPLVRHSDGTWDLMYQGEEGFQPMKVQKGTNVTEVLKIKKWEPEIPVHMAGEVCNLAGKTLKYDIENVKNYPEIFDALVNLNIDVHVTEKLHGCIHENTKITLTDGSLKTIKQIVNDPNIKEVMSYDVDSDTFVPRKITGKMVRPNTENKIWMVLTLENGNTLRITEDHPVFSKDRGKFIKAKDIKEGEDIKSFEYY